MSNVMVMKTNKLFVYHSSPITHSLPMTDL